MTLSVILLTLLSYILYLTHQLRRSKEQFASYSCHTNFLLEQKNPSRREFHDLGSDGLTAIFDLNEEIRRYLKHLQKRFLAKLIVIAFAEENEIRIVGTEIDAISRRLRRAFQGNEQKIQDDLSLSTYGIDTTYLFDITDSLFTGKLILGYSLNSPISSLELSWGKEVASALGLNLHYKLVATNLKNSLTSGNSVGASTATTNPLSEEGFLSSLSHDLRSPLNNIRAIFHLIEIGDIDQDTREVLEIGVSNCDRLNDLLDNLIDYTRIQANALIPQTEVFDLSTEVNAVAKTFFVNVKVKNLYLEVNLPKEIKVYFDKRHFSRVISNLLSNAIKYTVRGGVNISSYENEDKVILEIRDTGIGMSEEEVNSLFRPFTRFSKTEDGVGLGLTLTKALSAANRSELTLRSVVGNGSIFSLLIPKSKEVKELRVLLIDDDPDFLSTTSKYLTATGITTSKAKSVDEALRQISLVKPQLILSDYHFDGGGLPTLLKISVSLPPLFVLSGSGKLESLSLKDNEKIHRFFCKPVSLPELVKELWNYSVTR
jgi:signal transduction histidine kinase